jgi:hypothetical protein
MNDDEQHLIGLVIAFWMLAAEDLIEFKIVGVIEGRGWVWFHIPIIQKR